MHPCSFLGKKQTCVVSCQLSDSWYQYHCFHTYIGLFMNLLANSQATSGLFQFTWWAHIWVVYVILTCENNIMELVFYMACSTVLYYCNTVQWQKFAVNTVIKIHAEIWLCTYKICPNIAEQIRHTFYYWYHYNRLQYMRNVPFYLA